MKASWIALGANFAREIAAFEAVMARETAGTEDSEPLNLPMGVRVAERMTTS
jgi:hypothetical protein